MEHEGREVKCNSRRDRGGYGDVRDARWLREFICYVLDVAIARADDYYESDDEWREILRDMCDIEILSPEMIAELKEWGKYAEISLQVRS